MSTPPNEPTGSTREANPAAAAALDEVLARALEKALACQANGDLCQAEQLYRAILQARPDHAPANHQLGVLAVQRQQPALALPYLIKALEVSPQSPQFWLSYIDALLLTGQDESARQVLALGRQHGLAGEAVEQLAERLAPARTAGSPSAPAPMQANERRKAKRGTAPAGKPSAKEEERLVALVNSGRHAEGEALARTLSERFPQHGLGWKVLGTVLQAQGRSAEALTALRRASELLPEDAQIHSNLGLVLAGLNALAEAESCQRRAVQIKPDFAEAHYNLGNLLLAQQRHDDAEVSYRRALSLKPDFALAHCNLAGILLDSGRLGEAETTLRRALALQANLAEAHCNLGDVLRQLGRASDAEDAFRKAIACRPGFAAAHYHLGNTLKDLDRAGEAETAWRQALACQAAFPEALAALGGMLREHERLDEAAAALREAIAYRPHFAEAHFLLAATLRDQSLPDEAVAAWRRALECRADFPEALAALGSVLKDLGRPAEGEDALRRCLQLRPDFAEAHYNLANNLRTQGRLGEAEAAFRRALALQPNMANAWLNLSVTLNDQGRWSDAEETCRQALRIRPDYPMAHSTLLFWLTHNEKVDAQTLFAEHRGFGERYEAPLRGERLPHANSRDPERRLQIGLVSGDLSNHSVANFLEPVLAELAGYPLLTLHAYATQATDDHVTKRLKTHFHHWHAVAGLSDAALAQQIRSDAIDILIDLSGHTAHHRLLVFARKPAPVQASWMGYPGTTGLQAVDYFLADRFFLPSGSFDEQFSEKVVRLPASAAFLPFAEAPEPGPPPALKGGHVTFGSFNRPAKISPAVIALWSQLIRAVPGSRMLLAALPSDGNHRELIDDFARQGIARDRLSLHSRCDMASYLELHRQVDICLDTFPYTGGTTVLHALWMGVPTLTLAGGTAPGRAAASSLGHVGLDSFIAGDAADFLARGTRLASNLTMLAHLRAALRGRLRSSALGRPDIVAAGIENALRVMWRRWCNGLPAEAFDVETALPTDTVGT